MAVWKDRCEKDPEKWKYEVETVCGGVCRDLTTCHRGQKGGEDNVEVKFRRLARRARVQLSS